MVPLPVAATLAGPPPLPGVIAILGVPRVVPGGRPAPAKDARASFSKHVDALGLCRTAMSSVMSCCERKEVAVELTPAPLGLEKSGEFCSVTLSGLVSRAPTHV